MSTISSVSSTTYPTYNTAANTISGKNQSLNQSDFLKLLVSQIQYQDPMNPQSNTDMAAQLAQFTALQQASQSSSSLAMLQANSLVGSTVTVQESSSNSISSGVVTGVTLSNGTPQITVNGNGYALSQVLSIAPTQIQSTNSAANTNASSGTTTGADTGNSSNSSSTSSSNVNSSSSSSASDGSSSSNSGTQSSSSN